MSKSKIEKKIELYNYLSLNSFCPLEKAYYMDLIEKEEKNLEGIKREFTLDELSKYNGKNGEKAYIIVDSLVYDVTNVPLWQGGYHFQYIAGQDLTKAFNKAHKMDILVNIPKAGIVKK